MLITNPPIPDIERQTHELCHHPPPRDNIGLAFFARPRLQVDKRFEESVNVFIN